MASMWRDVHVGGARRKREMANEKILNDLSNCLDDLPTKSMESNLRPLVQQIVALLRHRGSTSSSLLTSPVKAVSTDQTIHVVSKAVTTFVQAGKAAAPENQDLNSALIAACHDAVKAGESFCRVLTQQPTTSHSGSHLSGISPSTSGSGSQNGVDSGVDEDLDEESLNLSIGSESERKEGTRPHGILKSSSNSSKLQGHQQQAIKTENRGRTTLADSFSDDDMRKTQLVTSSWDTVTSVIQILMLADQAAVSEVTHANEMVVEGLTRLESCQNFHEFMREFTEFGRRMINLAHYTGARQKDLKSDVARAYISATRFELEKGTAVLLTSSKVYFRHPSSNLARAFRDNCFTNMRSVLARMAKSLETCRESKSLSASGSLDDGISSICLTEKVKKNDDTKYISAFSLLDNLKLTVSSCHNSASLPSYNDVTGSLRHSSSFGSRIERISKQIMERALEFTDSPFCGHEQRSDILRRDLELRKSLGPFLNQKLSSSDAKMHSTSVEEAIENMKLSVCNAAVARIVGISNDLSSTGLYRRNFNVEALIENLTELSKCLSLNIANDTTKAVAALTEFSKQIQEACRLAQQCHVDPSHIVSIKHVCEFIEGLTQQVVRSVSLAQSLNGSPVAVENFTALIGQWHSVASSEISSMQTNLSSVARKASGGKSPSPVHDTIARSGNIYQRLDTSEQTVAARLGLEIKLLSAQCHVECQHWRDVEGASVALIENFESVASSSKHIYLFTRGEPPLHTTADFFNTAIDTSSYASRCGTIAESYMEERGLSTNSRDATRRTKQRSKSLTPRHRKSSGYSVAESGRASTISRKSSFGRYSSNNNNNNNNNSNCDEKKDMVASESTITVNIVSDDKCTKTMESASHYGSAESIPTRGAAKERALTQKHHKKFNACGIPFRAPSLKHLSIKSSK
uniref:alpha-catulin isoform X2 n=1 Tax=Ciona intestinalis TaxID=7719 RepID=UPI000EF510C6|nr:alpha-catulin isoform X2 [Ciona intestinalis]|eukprot:XP_026691944.1 alpha-catulin isoform X2 [Ciona intestinalis]